MKCDLCRMTTHGLHLWIIRGKHVSLCDDCDAAREPDLVRAR